MPPVSWLRDGWCNRWKDGGHNFHRIVSRKKYGAAHPGYFAGNQLAMMSDDEDLSDC